MSEKLLLKPSQSVAQSLATSAKSPVKLACGTWYRHHYVRHDCPAVGACDVNFVGTMPVHGALTRIVAVRECVC